MATFAEKARIAFGGTPPDWVQALAEYCDQPGVGLRGAHKRLGYSTSVISTVIRKKYVLGDLGRVEEKVRGLLLGLSVDCPELGEISRNVCLDWQGKPRAQTSSQRARMWRACGACPNFRAHGQRAKMESSNDDG